MANTVRKRKVEIPRRRNPIKPPPQVEQSEPSLFRESVAVLLLLLGIFLAASLYSYFSLAPSDSLFIDASLDQNLRVQNVMGPLGHTIARYLVSALGWCSFVTVIWTFLLSRTVWLVGWPTSTRSFSLWTICNTIFGSCGMAAACAVIAAVAFGQSGGGWVGAALARRLVHLVNEPGTILVGIAFLVFSLDLTAGVGSSRLLNSVYASLRLFQSILVESGAVFLRLLNAVWRGEMVFGSFVAAFLLNTLRMIRRLITFIVVTPFRVAFFPFIVLAQRLRPTRAASDLEDVSPADIDESDKPFVLGRTAKRSDTWRLGYENEAEEIEPKSARTAAKLKISRGNGAEESVGRKKLPKILSRRLIERRAKRARQEKTPRKREDIEGTKEFALPPLDVLVSGEGSHSTGPRDEELFQNSKLLEKALADFNVGGRVTEVNPGPVITLYEFQPAAGIKVQRVINLADDLALALRVASVRVFAPVPGKGSVGIEVPNKVREVVRLRDVLDSPEMSRAESSLSLALGKDTFGVPFTADLARMPHLLIAGATGTGKSVCINSLILSLLCRNTPDSLRFIMIDPKMLELSIYEGIPHLKAPVVTAPKHARGVLWWAVEEMERRYRLMKEVGVRHFASYNVHVGNGKSVQPMYSRGAARSGVIELEEKDVVAQSSSERGVDRSSNQELPFGVAPGSTVHERLPRIVIIVDELADLMLTVGREIEELLTRLAQKARAAGIHLILATQRPSVDVITGLIKANFPSRISFQVASRIDARTVLDTSGAEKLLGQGDMLFLDPSAAGVRRVHGAFVSDREVQDVVAWIRDQGEPRYDSAIAEMIERIESQDKPSGMELPEGDNDPLYDQAVSLVVEKGQASTSMVQRVFRIGYNRAARILEAMEKQGVVGPADGAKPRSVLVPGRDMI